MTTGSLLRCSILVPLVLVVAAAAQQSADRESLRIAEATRVDRAPKFDGTLDDPIWRRGVPIANFLQREPYEGQPPTERTEVRILYTKREIYFGIVCYDTVPGGIVATELRRDVSQELDDYFEIIIDSAHDHRNAYVFQINPLGTQRDSLITEEQEYENGDGDSGWDGVWTSAARISDQGWTATVSIPFSTLNFMSSHDVVWGLNFKRLIRRKNEEDLWSGWRRVFGASKVSEAGTLRGISEIGSGRLFIVKPYGLTGFKHLPSSAAGSGLGVGTDPLYTGGVDVKIGLRDNLVANFTGNTDFADADVDTQQFNLSPYKLFFPEKRPFFLENASVFEYIMGSGEPADRLFFSRQIGIDPITGQEVPINGGAKITGSLGRFELGAMDVDTRHSGPNPYANYSVVRVKRSLWSGSYLGAIGIDKRSGDPFDHFNQSSGVDGRFVFFKNLIAQGTAAQTRTPGLTGAQTDLGANLTYDSNLLGFNVEHRKIGRNFNPEVGFLERSDCICDFVDAEIKQRPKIRGLREINFEGFIYHAPDTSHVLQTQEWQATVRIEFHDGSYSDDDIVDVFTQRLTTPFNIYKNVFIPVGVYHWTRHQLTYGSPLNRRLTGQVYERFGGYYNGHLNETRVRWTYRPNARLSFIFGQQWNRFRLPLPNGNFSVVFGSLQTNYSLSRFLTLSSLLQMNTANNQAASANIRLRWNYRPDSDLYLIYTAGQRFASLTADNPMQLYEHRFAIKYTYSWKP